MTLELLNKLLFQMLNNPPDLPGASIRLHEQDFPHVYDSLSN